MQPITRTDDGSVVLENSAVRIELETKRGGIVRSWIDKRSGREEVYLSADKKFGSLGEPRFGGKPAKEFANEPRQVSILKDTPEIKVVAFSRKSGSGPNQGIECRTVYTFRADRAVLEIEWQIINHTDKLQRITPWVRNTVAGYQPLEVLNVKSKLVNTGDTSFPSEYGHMHKLAAENDFFITPARNWFARVAKEYQDPKNGVLYFVFDYNAIFQLYILHFKYIHCMEMVFAPFDIQPGKTASARFSVCAGGSLKDVRFASTYAAADLERVKGKLRLSVTATGDYGEVTARLLDGSGKPAGEAKLKLEQCKVAAAEFADVPGNVFELQLLQNGKDLMRPEYDPNRRFKMTGTLDTVVSKNSAYVDEPKTFEAWKRETPAFPDIPSRTIAVRYPLKSADPALTGWAEPGSTRIFEADVPAEKLPKVSTFFIAAAANERENFQIALRNSGKDDLTGLTVAIRGWEKIAPDCVWHPVDYIRTTQPSSFGNFPVGRWPDVLLDPGEFTLPRGKTRCVFVSVKVPKGTKAGRYATKLEVRKDGETLAELPLALRVFGFELPRTPALRTDVGGFFNKPVMSQMLKKDFGVTRSAKDLETELFDHLLSRRISPRGFIGGCADPDKFEAELTRRIGLGATSFFIPKNLTPKQRLEVERILEKHGVLNRSFVYAFDEIHPEQAARINKWCYDWHRKSKIRILVVYYSGPVEPFYGSIDIWCRARHPDDKKLLTGRVAAGDEVWHTNSPLFKLETDVVEGRTVIWDCFNIGMTGCLLWSCAPLTKNPYKQPFRSGTNLHGVLYYPTQGKNGLVPSIRLETFADAIDDYDYLTLLKRHAADAKKRNVLPKQVAEAEALLKLPIPKDVYELNARRLRIGELIELFSAE